MGVSFSLFGQSNRVGIIDHYGSAANESEIAKCLPFKVGDSVTFLTEEAYPEFKRRVANCLMANPNVKEVEVYPICCDEKGNWMIFVGVSNTKSEKLYHPEPQGDLKLPVEVKAAYDSLMDLVMVSIEKGKNTEDDSQGHALTDYPPSRKIQLRFVNYANKYRNELTQVLRQSRHGDHRAAAATVLAYYSSKEAIINDLLYAVTDPDEHVRNDATRAIGIIINYAQAQKLKIVVPPEPFIRMYSSISWSDRNKSCGVLLALCYSGDNALVERLKREALGPIVDMAKWKSFGHAAPGYYMLGKIAGWSTEQMKEGLKDRDLSVKQMLEQIKK